MRHKCAQFSIASDFNLPTDAAYDWTADNSRLTPILIRKFMDDAAEASLSGTDIMLPRGIWRAHINIHFRNITTTQVARVALTNLAGTTLHYRGATQDVKVDADTAYSAVCVFLINTLGAGINLRAIAGGGVNLVSVRADSDMLVLEKIGNYNEIGKNAN